MNRVAFLKTLRNGLAGLPTPERDDILSDYTAYFDDALASGRTEEDVADGLGDPGLLARELRAESGISRWEERPSVGNLLAAAAALGGLAAVSIFVLLPLLLLVGLVVVILCVSLLVLGIAGVVEIVGVFSSGAAQDVWVLLPRLLTGIGYGAGSIGGAALLLLAMRVGMAPMVRYARLRYRVLKPLGSGS